MGSRVQEVGVDQGGMRDDPGKESEDFSGEVDTKLEDRVHMGGNSLSRKGRGVRFSTDKQVPNHTHTDKEVPSGRSLCSAHPWPVFCACFPLSSAFLRFSESQSSPQFSVWSNLHVGILSSSIQGQSSRGLFRVLEWLPRTSFFPSSGPRQKAKTKAGLEFRGVFSIFSR